MTPGARIYFIRPVSGGPIKIGVSKYVGQRLLQLASWSPVDLEILATTPGNLYDERAVHRAFAGQRLHREWFAPSPELLALDALNAGDPLPKHMRGKCPVWKAPVRRYKGSYATREAIEAAAAKRRETWAKKREAREAAQKHRPPSLYVINCTPLTAAVPKRAKAAA